MTDRTREENLILQADRLDARLSRLRMREFCAPGTRLAHVRARNEARYWRRIARFPETVDQLGYHRYNPLTGLYDGIVYEEDEN